MKSQIRLFRVVLKGKRRPTSWLNSALALSLLLLATTGCKLLNFNGGGQVNSNSGNSNSAPSGISVPAGYEKFLPQQVGTFQLTRAWQLTRNPSDPDLEDVTGLYQSPNWPETQKSALSVSIRKYPSDSDASAQMARTIEANTTTHPELMQYKVVSRTPGGSGGERVLLRNTDPENSIDEKVMWVNGSYFFIVQSGSYEKKYGVADDFVKGYPQ
jgi:hypothetical protein